MATSKKAAAKTATTKAEPRAAPEKGGKVAMPAAKTPRAAPGTKSKGKT